MDYKSIEKDYRFDSTKFRHLFVRDGETAIDEINMLKKHLTILKDMSITQMADGNDKIHMCDPSDMRQELKLFIWLLNGDYRNLLKGFKKYKELIMEIMSDWEDFMSGDSLEFRPPGQLMTDIGFVDNADEMNALENECRFDMRAEQIYKINYDEYKKHIDSWDGVLRQINDIYKQDKKLTHL
tara:strand:+ start:159 stop:707 length:549 start_codon:yes stop_codon:yes gene_type:complete